MNRKTIFSLSNDNLRYIALNLSYDEIVRWCHAAGKFRKAICEDNYFWKNKILHDYPRYPLNELDELSPRIDESILNRNRQKVMRAKYQLIYSETLFMLIADNVNFYYIMRATYDGLLESRSSYPITNYRYREFRVDKFGDRSNFHIHADALLRERNKLISQYGPIDDLWEKAERKLEKKAERLHLFAEEQFAIYDPEIVGPKSPVAEFKYIEIVPSKSIRFQLLKAIESGDLYYIDKILMDHQIISSPLKIRNLIGIYRTSIKEEWPDILVYINYGSDWPFIELSFREDGNYFPAGLENNLSHDDINNLYDLPFDVNYESPSEE